MLMTIANVINDDSIAELRADLSRLAFSDGRTSAGFAARIVKQNMQAAPDPLLDLWRDRIANALLAHPLVQMAARPKRVVGPMFSRYRSGDQYGLHVDDAMIDGVRADLSFTLFLSDPTAYDGGELVIESTAGSDSHKAVAGCIVLYPTTSLHRVAPVTRGERLAAIGWVSSAIRDAAQRELLFDLDTARHRIFETLGKSTEYDLLSKSSANLMRMWCD